MIVVTGATGHFGGLVVRSLLRRNLSPDSIGICVRDPNRAVALSQMGVRVRQGDFDNKPSLQHAFEGASQVLVVSSNGRREGKDPIAQHANAIKAAKAAGVERIVYTSHMAAAMASKFPPMQDHARTEELLKDSGLAWTALRNGFYAASALDLMRNALQSKEVALPLDGKICWTAHDDLADAAAEILLNKTFDGPSPPLTGEEALDMADLAALYSAITGNATKRVIVSDESFAANLKRNQVPDAAISVIMGLYAASRSGEFNRVDPALSELIKRRPTPMRQVLASAINHLNGNA